MANGNDDWHGQFGGGMGPYPALTPSYGPGNPWAAFGAAAPALYSMARQNIGAGTGDQGGMGGSQNAMTPYVGAAGTNPTFPGYDPTNMGAQSGMGWSVGAAQPSMGIQTGVMPQRAMMPAPGYTQAMQGPQTGRGGGGAGLAPFGYLPLAQFARGAGALGAAMGGGTRPVGGGMVMLRAPNGQTKAVPADQVQHYLARGAQQV